MALLDELPIRVNLSDRRAALYVRVSTSDKGQTVENQLQPLQEAAGRLGWTMVAAFPRRRHQWRQGAASGRPESRSLSESGSISPRMRTQFDALLAPPPIPDAIYIALFVLWVAAIIMLGMIDQNLDATIHPDEGP